MRRHVRAARMAAIVAGAVVIVAGVGPGGTTASAQQAGEITVRLVAQPVWHDPEDDLNLKLRITNRGLAALEGFNLSLAIFPRTLNRSGLHASFDGVSGLSGSFPKAYPEVRVLPGQSTTVTVRDAVSALPLLTDETQEGIYPLTVQLYDASGVQLLDAITTQILYYPHETDSPRTPLNLVLAIPINDIPRRGPDGVFHEDVDGQWPLQAAIAPDGWLTGLMDALESRAGRQLHLGIAPTPRLVEEIADMADGFKRGVDEGVERVPGDGPVAAAASSFLRRLKDLIERDRTQALLVPYSFPDLPVLIRRLGALTAQDEIDVGEDVLNEVLGVAITRTALLAPGARLDLSTLEQLRRAAAADVAFFFPESIEPAADPALGGCPERSPSFTCPMYVDTSLGRTTGYASDKGLQDRFGALRQGGDTRLLLQNLFAETAMIREELPSVPGRVVQATMPSLWHPTPRISRLLVRGLARAPWLSTWTPKEGLHNGTAPVEQPIVDSLPDPPGEPGEFYFQSVAQAADLVEHFRSLNPPQSVIERLSHNVLAAHSRTWWAESGTDSGEAFATATRAEINDELGKIRVGGVDEITLTSRGGEILFPIFNDTGYPVDVLVRLESDDLEIDEPEVTMTLDQPTRQLAFDVHARSSGTFPLTIKVETPDGFLVADKQIGIRSTTFNQIALGITFGALAFLVGFYIFRGLRRRRATPATGAGPA